jgi:hypothetical protein
MKLAKRGNMHEQLQADRDGNAALVPVTGKLPTADCQQALKAV